MELDSPVLTSSIPASSFPHIIDSIVEFASPSVLIAFRNTCREYRQRITESSIADRLQRLSSSAGLHLHLEATRVCGPHLSRDPECGHKLVATFPTPHGPCPAPTFLASHVRIVTLHAAELDGDFGVTMPAARRLEEAGVSLDVVRITDFEGATAKIPFKAPKYVLFLNADHVDDGWDETEEDDPMDIEMEMEMEMDYHALPSNSNSTRLPANSGACSGSLPIDAYLEQASPFPDNVKEVVCNIACSPTAGCTNLSRSQLSALNLGRRGILSNLIYIFRPTLEGNNSDTSGHEDGVTDGKPLQKGKDKKTKEKDNATHRRPSRSRSSSPASTASSLPGSPPESPAVVPFLDSQLSCFPSPDFTIVGCENLRYWADPESTLFARFASIMNAYCDFEISMNYLHPVHGGGEEDPDVQVEVALGFNVSGGDDLDRSRYFKSFPQWTASHARSARARAWYELMTVP